MKIGVHLGSGVPQSGGQFTFQLGVSQSLARLAAESRHSFIVAGTPNLLMQPTKNVHVISTAGSFAERAYSRLDRSVSRLRNTLLGRNHAVPMQRDALMFMKMGVDMMWYVGPFCSTMEIPYIYTVLDLQHLVQPYFPEVSNNGVWDSREQHYSVALRRAARIVVSTEVGKAEIERFYQIPGERIVVLPYAAPAADAATAQDHSWVLAKHNVPPGFLFYPAQLWPHKNHIGLLHAVRLLRDGWNISLPVVFVGSDAGNRQHVEDCISRLGLSEQVRMLGFVPREDVTALYRNAFALTMPTLVGPDNIPALEAFALGCPVITSDLPGLEEQLGNAALLVDPTDEREIALAIKSLHDDPSLRAELVQRGLQAIGRWTWDDYVNGVAAIFDRFEPVRRTWTSAGRNSE